MPNKKKKSLSTRRYTKYSHSFKTQVVDEIEVQGQSIRSVQHKYGIACRKTIREWLDKYGILDRRYKQARMKKTPEQEILALRQELLLLKKQNKVLEQQADMSSKKAAFFDLMVDVAEEEFNIEIRKKYATVASKRIKQKLD